MHGVVHDMDGRALFKGITNWHYSTKDGVS